MMCDKFFKKKNILFFVVFGIFFALLFPFLYWYVPSFDGSYNLQIPKNLVLLHQYQTDKALFDVAITTGYPVLLPITLTFFVFGISIMGSKLVMFAFFISLLVGIFLVSKSVFESKKIQWIIVFIFAFLFVWKIPGAMLYLFEVIGELPAISFLLLAFFFLSRYYKNTCNGYEYLIISGLMLGFSVETKFIMLLSLPAFLLLFFLESHKSSFKKVTKDFLILLISAFIPSLLFIVFQISQSNVSEFIQNKKEFVSFLKNNAGSGVGMQSLSRIDIFLKHLEVTKNDLGIVWVGWFGILLSLTYFLYWCVRKKFFIGITLLLFLLTYSIWWFFINGSFWMRHFIPALVILFIILAMLIGIFIENLHKRKRVIFSIIAMFLLFFSLNFLKMDTLLSNFNITVYKYTYNTYEEAQFFFKRNLLTNDVYYRGWWQVPEISLFSKKPFLDLNKTSIDVTRDNYFIMTSLEKSLAPETYLENITFCKGEYVFENDGYKICRIKK